MSLEVSGNILIATIYIWHWSIKLLIRRCGIFFDEVELQYDHINFRRPCTYMFFWRNFLHKKIYFLFLCFSEIRFLRIIWNNSMKILNCGTSPNDEGTLKKAEKLNLIWSFDFNNCIYFWVKPIFTIGTWKDIWIHIIMH